MTDVRHEPATLTVTRADVEDFLYHEAALLDEWRLEEWLDEKIVDLPSIMTIEPLPSGLQPSDPPVHTGSLAYQAPVVLGVTPVDEPDHPGA